MKKEHLKYIVCPNCRKDLYISEQKNILDKRIESGNLICSQCKRNFPIIRFIPRFVPIENYASSFGYEWLKHAKTQYDSYWGASISEKRFFEETKWLHDLKGQVILEVGCGSGRFTEQAVSTGAMVVSMDYSYAVEANYASHGKKDNVFIIQADLYHMPFRENYFDKLFCFGVLQHTPDVRRSFFILPKYLKKGGDLAIDVYRKRQGIKKLFGTRYFVRPITKRIKPKLLYKIISNYVNFIWPLTRIIHKLPYGTKINWIVFLVADYIGRFNLTDEKLKEWAILDTFDVLSPAYDNPQTLQTLRQWFKDTELSNVEVHYGYNGIEGRGRKQ